MKKITFTLLAITLCLFNFNASAQTTLISEDFNGLTAGNLPNLSGNYNYTQKVAWDSSDKTSPSFVIHGGSGSTKYVAATVGGNEAMKIMGGANFGVNGGLFITGLDLGNTTAAGNILNFSFKIYGGGGNPDVDPAPGNTAATLAADWGVHLNFNTGNAVGLSAHDSGFFASSSSKVIRDVPVSVDGAPVATKFSIPENKWTTFSGSIDLSGKTLGSLAAIQIRVSGSTSYWISGGFDLLAVDDIQVNRHTGSTLSTTTNELVAAGLNIYPNPVSGILNISKTDGILINSVKLSDVTGKVVYQSNNANAINVSDFSKGLYILNVASKSGAVFNTKVIVE